MIKYLIVIILTGFVYLCSCSKHTFDVREKTAIDPSYEVTKIKKVNSWYFIYFQRNDSIFKTVSHEPADKAPFKGYHEIRKHNRYNLLLLNFKDYEIFEGENVWPLGYSGCLDLDSITAVCMEPENGIWDLYFTHDLEGLYYLK